MKDSYYMSKALIFAKRAATIGEIPIGALLVLDNTIIGTGFNCPITTNDPSAHAEVLAIRSAAIFLKNYRLPGTTLYVTLEPCAMCSGLILYSRIARVVYGAKSPKNGVIESQDRFFEKEFLNHKVEHTGGILKDECSSILQEMFKIKREKIKS